MSSIITNKNIKVAAGATLVALSGFVPQPMMQQAVAASATLAVTGSFISGITISSATGIEIGSIIASGSTGTAKVTPGGAGSGSSGTIIGGSGAGKIKAKYQAAKPIDVIVAGFGTLGLATNTATLDKLYFTGVFSATVAGGTATATASALAKNLTGTGSSKVVNLGAGVSWTGGKPGGAFSKNVVITIVY